VRHELLVLVQSAFLIVGVAVVVSALWSGGSSGHPGLWKRWRRRNWTADDWAKVPGRELFPEIFRRDDD
jgi:hypothetical protein